MVWLGVKETSATMPLAFRVPLVLLGAAAMAGVVWWMWRPRSGSRTRIDSTSASTQPRQGGGPMHVPMKLFVCDLNWSRQDNDVRPVYPSLAHEWAFVDPREYFEYHREFGNSAIFLQAYTFGGYAFYPTELGPVAPGPGRDLLPQLYELARAAGMPCSTTIRITH